MKLYWSPQTRSTRALWMLEEAGLDYQRERVDIRDPDRHNTAADVMLGSSVVFMRMFDMLPDSTALGAYADRCLARPAYQRALELNETIHS